MYLNHAYFKTRSDSVHAQLFKLDFIFFNLHFIFFKLHVSYFNILFIFFKSTFIFFKLVFIFFKSRLKRCRTEVNSERDGKRCAFSCARW